MKTRLFTLVFMVLAVNAQAQTSPSSTIVKVFEMMVSTSSDCSGPIMVFQTANPTPVDFAQLPTFGVGSIPDFTYHCLMFHIDDLITVVPQTTDGVCVAASPSVVDIYSDPGEDYSVTPAGAPIIAHPGVEDDPWIYFSDSSQSSATNNCFAPNTNGCACSGPCPLTAFAMRSDTTHTLVVDLDNKLVGSGAACTVNQPISAVMSFR